MIKIILTIAFITSTEINAASQHNDRCLPDNWDGHWSTIKQCYFDKIDRQTETLGYLKRQDDLSAFQESVKKACSKEAEEFGGEMAKHIYWDCFTASLQSEIDKDLAKLSSNVDKTEAEYTGTRHDWFAFTMEATDDAVNCSIKIKPSIIESTPLSHPESTFEENLWNAARQLDWNFVPPGIFYDGSCRIRNSSDFFKGQPAVVHAHPDWEGIKNGEPHFFFYIKRMMDTLPELEYSISWNGSVHSTHAQWFITENAKLKVDGVDAALSKGGSINCLVDEKIEICFN
jgi:hypothetical protein